jgi:molybdopterin-guanine dinucleotide biosynthesis protein A
VTQPPLLAGVFVGGAGSRLGGVAKGLMRAPGGGTLVDRWCRLLADLGIDVVLVGDHEAYRDLGLPLVDDDPPGIGPLGGLVGLLRRAGEGHALALACDMPFVSPGLLARLAALARQPDGPRAVAPRTGGAWEPLFAAYDARHVLPVAVARAARGARSLQGLLDEAGALELPLDPGQAAELKDWDTPADRSG